MTIILFLATLSLTKGQSQKADTASKKVVGNKKLQEVQITGNKDFIEHKIDRVIINVSALLSNTGTNVIDVLNNAPGVEVVDNAISIRGKQGVSVYIDGKQSYLSGNDLFNYLQSLPSGTIDKIEIITSPPANYHVNGNAGIINIITKRTSVKGFNGNVSVSYGQGKYAKTNNSLSLTYNAKQLSFYGSVGYSSIDNYYDVNRLRDFTMPPYVLNQLNFETNHQKSYNYKAVVNYDPNKWNNLQLSFTGSKIDYSEAGNYLLQFMPYNGGIDSTTKTISQLYQHTRNNLINAGYQHKFKNTGEDLTLGFDYFDYSNPSDQTLLSNSYLVGNSTAYSTYNLVTDNFFDAQVFGVNADYNKPLTKDIKLSMGILFVHSNRNSSNSYSGQLNDFSSAGTYQINTLNYTETNKEGYFSLVYKFKWVEAKAGLRYQQTTVTTAELELPTTTTTVNDYQYKNLLPTVYLTGVLDAEHLNTLLFSFNKRVSRPGYESLNPSAFYFDKYTANQGNALLKPEDGINFDLSFNHGNSFTIGTTYSHSQNTIVQVYEFVNTLLANTTVNLNHFSNAVLYSNVSQFFTKIWSVNLYGELAYSSYQGVITNEDYLNNQITSGKVTFTNQFKFGNGWGLEATGLYRSKRTFGQGVYQPQAIANLTLQKKVLHNNGSITLVARDIFHSQIVNRDIDLPQAHLSIRNENDTQVLTLNFTYRFGSTSSIKINKSGLENEQKRVGQ